MSQPPPPIPGMPDEAATEAALARLVSGFAAAIALLLVLTVPLMYGWSQWREARAVMRAEVGNIALGVSSIASLGPDLWVFQRERLQSRLANSTSDATLRVIALDGVVLAEAQRPLAWPQHRLAAPVFDSGRIVGRVEIAASLRPALEHAGLVALLSAILGAVAYTALRLLPLRLLRQAMSRVSYLATHDQLTGLPNRRLFQDRLQQASARHERHGGGFAVLYLDLDRFKDVNDTFGHQAGDILLRRVARILSASLRESDTLARLGGDEFAIIQDRAEQPESAEALALRLAELLAQPFDLNGHQATIGTSIGIALSDDSTADRILQDADTALYRAKTEGRNGFRFFAAEMNQALADRRAMERDLRLALQAGQFCLHFQPQVDLATRAVTGFEALLRWNHPVRGEVMPDQFIPLAEELGLLTEIGAWVLRQACATAMRWPGRTMAVNVSGNQFRSADFVPAIRSALQQSGLEPRRLEIEVSEALLRADTGQTLATLQSLRALGVSVAMDDFDRGYSSLGQLHRYRFDRIKIDRSVVRGLSEDPRSIAVIRAIVGITQAFGLRCMAEGVETPAEATLLLAEGCTDAQGWLFGRAVPEAELGMLLGDCEQAAA